MRQREKFISSFRKTTSLFVVVVIGFFLASFLSIFFSLCRLNLRRNYAHVLAKHFVRFSRCARFLPSARAPFLDFALIKEINRLFQIFQDVNWEMSNN